MIREIQEQPECVERVVRLERENAISLAREIRERGIRFAVIAARGTSDNAATYGKYLLEIVAGMPVALAAPSVYTLYDAHPSLSGALVIGISQSGEGTDVVQVLSQARGEGALTACITNSPGSPITLVSDYTFLCHAGEERAVAATKTYTTALAVVALIAAHLSGNQGLLSQLGAVVGHMRGALALEEGIERSVERYRYMQECAVLGRGVSQATALEAALKMTETSYIVAKPYSGADFLHGPIAMVSEGFPCFLFAPGGQAYPFMLELAMKIRERSGELIVFSSEPELLELAAVGIPLPATESDLLSPLVAILPAQLFACHLARSRGHDPDSPRGLTKVTRTL
jgi:glucosamine--fructose-6-phosphate aminotransferase (isomerizing)